MSSSDDDSSPQKVIVHRNLPPSSRLPVQLTWKGVKIQFPSVVLTKELKQAADDVLKKQISTQEQPTPTPKRKSVTPTPSILGSSNKSKTEKNFICSICKIQFATEYNLTRHSIIHSENVGKCGPCHCGAFFAKAIPLRRHMELCAVARQKKDPDTISQNSNVSDGLVRIKVEHIIEDDYEHEHSFELPEHQDSPEENHMTVPSTSLVPAKFSIAPPKQNNSNDNDNGHVVDKEKSQIKCDKCQRTFSSSIYLGQHLAKSTLCGTSPDVIRTNCPYCDTLFSAVKGILKHLKAYHKCQRCGQDFANTGEGLMHRENCTNEKLPPDSLKLKTYKCSTCNVRLSPRELIKHKPTHNNNPSSSLSPPSQNVNEDKAQSPPQKITPTLFECDTCGKGFTKKYLRKHKARCDLNPPNFKVKCPYCKMNFKTIGSAVLHLRKHHRCGKCGINLKSCSESMLHNQHCLLDNAHDPKETKSIKFEDFLCPDCPLSFSAADLVRHEATCHRPSTSAAAYATKPEPKQSTSKQLAAVPTAFTCKFLPCDRFFSHEEDLWFHIDRVHRSVGNICCGQCGEGFESEELVTQHEEKFHAPSVPVPVVPVNEIERRLSVESHETLPLPINKVEEIEVEVEADFHFDDSELEATSFETTSPKKIVKDVSSAFVLIEKECKEVADKIVLLQKENDVNEDEIPYDQDSYTCKKCSDLPTFYERMDYIQHMKNEHKNKNPIVYVCDCCEKEPKIFSSKVELKQHATGKKKGRPRVDIPVQDEYSCEKCNGKKFTDRTNYLQHLAYHSRLEKSRQPVNIQDQAHVPKQSESVVGNMIKDFESQKEYIVRNDEFSPMASPSKQDSLSNTPYQNVYKCETCKGRTFNNRNAYIGHVMYHRVLTKKGINRSIMSKDEWKKRREHYKDEIPEQNEYACNICADDRKFLNKQSFLAHKMYHDRIRQKFGQDRPLKKRWEKGPRGNSLESSIPDQDEYFCQICNNRKFENKKSYAFHLRYHKIKELKEGKSGPVKTREEFFRSSRGGILSTIPDLDVYECKTCQTKYKSKPSYYQHLLCHKKMGNNGPIIRRQRGRPSLTSLNPSEIPYQDQYQCEECETDKIFDNRQAYINHLNYHTKRQQAGLLKPMRHRRSKFNTIPLQGTYRCKRCSNKLFANRQQYITHLNYHRFKDRANATVKNSGLLHNALLDPVGLSINSYACKICGEDKTFTSLESYEQHQKEHRAANKKHYKCSICEKGFDNSWALASHAKSHNSKTIICGDCGKRFSLNFQLQQHQSYSCKKFQCKYTCHCGDKFHTVDSLERHCEKEHPEPAKTSFKCYVCDEQFVQSFELDFHVRVSHPVDYEEFLEYQAGKNNKQETASPENEALPLYPEVIMNPHSPGNTPVKDQNNEANQNNNSGGGWNFIASLAGNNRQSDEDDDEGSNNDDIELLPESFEPEDVEVGQIEIADPISLSKTMANQFNSKPKYSGKKRKGEVDFDYNPSEAATKPAKRKYTNEGNFKCGYCDKKSHRLAYLKTHFQVHQGLPFKYYDLSNPKERMASESAQNISTISNYSRFSNTSGTQMPVATVAPQQQQKSQQSVPVTSTAGRRNSYTSKLPPKCGCALEETELGLHKRCTGEKCACYSKFKGCSDECECQRSCGNPYFRAKPPQPQITTMPSTSNTLPDLVQTSEQINIQIKSLENQINDIAKETIIKRMSATNNTTGETAPVVELPRPFVRQGRDAPLFRTYGSVTGLTNSNLPVSFLSQTPITATTTFRLMSKSGQVLPNRIVTLPTPSPKPVQTKIYRCFCQQDFYSLPSFLTHQWDHKKEHLFLCPICSQQFTNVPCLIQHTSSHKEMADVVFRPCSACEVLLASKEELEQHFIAAHSNLICDICRKFCTSVTELLTHRSIHGHCDLCGLNFFNQTAMRNHLARDHANVQQRPAETTPTLTQRAPGVVTINLEDSDDEVQEVRPKSPEFPVIVSVAGSSSTN